MKETLNEIKKLLDDKDLPRTTKSILHFTKEELENQIYCQEHKDENLKKALQMSKDIKNIQFGCGNHHLKDYINVDIIMPADVIWDIRENVPFEDNSINKIFSEHMLEHIDYPISVNNFLSECYRILKDGGEFIVGIPDCSFPLEDIQNNSNENLKKAIEEWYKKREDVTDNMKNSIDYLNYVMRDQLFHEKYHAHFWGYTYENLSQLLEKHGFKNIEVWNVDMNIINPKRLWGTLYIRGTK